MRLPRLACCFLVACLSQVQTAVASEGLLELLSVLRDNGQISKEQYDKLASVVEDDMDAQDEERDSQLHLETEGGLAVATYDGEFSFELGGRIMVDGAYYDIDGDVQGDDDPSVFQTRIQADF